MKRTLTLLAGVFIRYMSNSVCADGDLFGKMFFFFPDGMEQENVRHVI